MAYVIGVDEAGYGPNLGPLVVGASAWEYDGGRPIGDALAELSHALANQNGRGNVEIADSKVLYQAGQGLARLELSLLAALAACGILPNDWDDAWRQLVTTADGRQLPAPATSPAWPVAVTHDAIVTASQSLATCLADAGWRLLTVTCRPMFPGEFNASLRRLGNKSDVLSQASLRLVARILAELPAADAHVFCDKHGGRNRYAAVLQDCFPDCWIAPYCESAERSSYSWQQPRRTVHIEFRARGESLPPTALASMAAKYLRELAMHAFNAFWRDRVPGLHPTAGYPVDARRFREDIRAAQQELGISDAELWRER